ncbi:thiol peroxidase [Bhargavaea massiliensis]|uniref:thiol peroxidase n=1 Tax=Bhargavaea massiliensis TaxID=2697500 RepID=UPI001BCCD2CE|nr:thiol peroxidase [Bhargavaea massiliensis]
MAQVTFKQQPVTLLGTEIKVGDEAPDFTVLQNDLSPFTLKDTEGKIRLISVIPSIDTGVCSTQTKRFNEAVTDLGDDVAVLTISVDLPFAQARWKASEGLDNAHTLSDHRDLSFGTAYGVVMKELRLLARSVFVIGKDGKVAYVEYVPEGTDHPDYDQAIDAVKKLAE